MHIAAQHVFREADDLGLADSFQMELIPMATERNFLSKKAAIRNSRIRAGRMKVCKMTPTTLLRPADTTQGESLWHIHCFFFINCVLSPELVNSLQGKSNIFCHKI